MAEQEITEQNVEAFEPFEEHFTWLGGAAAGVVATVVMGLGMWLVEPALLVEYIPGLYGFGGSLAVGWLVHLFHGALFGLAFAVVMADPSLVGVTARVWKSVVAGVVFGIVLAVVGMGVIMPMWSSAMGIAGVATVPFVTGTLLAWHVLFGAVLGGLFAVVDRRRGTPVGVREE